MKTRVFIALASHILGGPGKGLVQFLNNGGLEGCEPLLGVYAPEHAASDSEYITAMRATGAPVAVLRQRRVVDYGLVEQALGHIRRHNTGLLESNGYKSHVLCWLLRQKTGLPWIAVVHGWTAENLKIRCYTALEHAMLLLADQVVAVSESLRQRLLPGVRSKCLVIPNAIDAGDLRESPPPRNIRSELGLAEDAVVAGIVGRLSPEKGHLVFVRALAEARKGNPALCGIIVGDGQERPRIEAEVRALDLERHCLFTGHVREVAPYYRAMDMQAMPSFSEGMPYAALEGMRMGLPVIASTSGGIPEVVQDGATGLLLPSGDASALCRAMLALAGNPELRARFGRAGRARVEASFSPRARVEKILKLYAATAQKGRKERI